MRKALWGWWASLWWNLTNVSKLCFCSAFGASLVPAWGEGTLGDPCFEIDLIFGLIPKCQMLDLQQKSGEGASMGKRMGIRATLRFTWYLNRMSRSSTKNIAWDFDVRLDSKTPRWVFLNPIFSISVECLAGCYRCRKEGEQTYICFRTDTGTRLRFGPSFTFRTSPWIRTDSNFMTSSKAKSSWNPPCGILHHVFNLTLGAKLEIEGSNFSPHTSRAEVKECLKEYRNKERGCSPS